MALSICQNPWNFILQRVNLNVYKFLKSTRVGDLQMECRLWPKNQTLLLMNDLTPLNRMGEERCCPMTL